MPRKALLLLVLLCLRPAGLSLGQTLDAAFLNMYNPLLHAPGTCTSATLLAAIAVPASAQKLLYLGGVDVSRAPCVWEVTEPVTSDPGRPLYLPAGTTVHLLPGNTLTACIQAGDYPIFTGTGSLRIPRGCTGEVQAAWWPKTAPGLQSADAAAQASGLPLAVRNGDWTVSANLTAQAQWKMDAGAVVTVAPGATLTLHKAPIAGLYPVFEADQIATGRVQFSQAVRLIPDWFGARPDNVTSVTRRFQAMLDSLRGVGGSVYVPPTGQTHCYAFDNPVFVHSQVTIDGDEDASCLRNTRAVTPDPFWRSALLLPGSMSSQDLYGYYGQTYYPVQDLAAGTVLLTLTVAADAAHFQVGDLVCLKTQAFYVSAHKIPHTGEINEVLGVSSGTLTLKYPTDFAMTSPEIAECSRGTVQDPTLVIDGVPIPSRLVKRVTIKNLSLYTQELPADTAGAAIAVGGCFECSIDNIRFAGHAFFSTNGWSRSTIRNVRGRFSRKGFDIAMMSHDFLVRDGVLTQNTVSSSPSVGGILVGERTHRGTFDNLTIDMTRQPGDFSLVGMGTARGMKLVNSQLIATQLDNYLVNLASNVVVPSGNIIANNEFWAGASMAGGVNLTSTNSNVVQGNIFHLLGSRPGWKAVFVRLNSFANTIIGNTVLNQGLIYVEPGAWPANTFAGNRDWPREVETINNFQKTVRDDVYTDLLTDDNLPLRIPAKSTNKQAEYCMLAHGSVAGTVGTKDIILTINGVTRLTLHWEAAEQSRWFIRGRIGFRPAPEEFSTNQNVVWEAVDAGLPTEWVGTPGAPQAGLNYRLFAANRQAETIDTATTDVVVNLQGKTADPNNVDGDAIFFFGWKVTYQCDG